MKKAHNSRMISSLAAGLLLMLSGCGKDDTPGPSSSDLNFKPNDFKITITNIHINETSYSFDYEVKNLKNEAYGDDEGKDGDYWIRFKIKTTDDTEYQDEDFIENLSANGASVEDGDIYFPNGKTVDESTFTYEIYLND